MPIKTISGEFRPPRLAKIRLGYKKRGASGDYPKDTDCFIGRREDGITDEILAAYNKGRIDEAEGETFNLGKSLRMLTYFEWDARHPRKDTELVVNLLNRAWSATKIRCSGTGGNTDERGEAFVRDEAYKDAIYKATKVKPRERKGGWDVVCLGADCPMWHSNTSTNKNATCHHELRFLAQLLDPATNPEDPKYLKNMGSVEIVSGSFNGMLDVQSGLQLLRSVAGRSANVPFTLYRKPRTMLVDGKRLVKATLMVGFDNDEAIRFGYTDPQLALVRPEIRKQLMANKREQLQLAQMEVGIDSVRDVVPRLEAPRPSESPSDSPLLSSEEGRRTAEVGAGDSSASVVGDREEVIDEAVGESQPAEEDLERYLTNAEREELKTLCGAKPAEDVTPEERQASLAGFRAKVAEVYKHFEEKDDGFTGLRVRHQLWIKQAIAIERGEA